MSIQTRRERERAERERLIVTAARKLAEAEGWDAVTTRRLAAEIDYSQPVLYSHSIPPTKPRGRAVCRERLSSPFLSGPESHQSRAWLRPVCRISSESSGSTWRTARASISAPTISLSRRTALWRASPAQCAIAPADRTTRGAGEPGVRLLFFRDPHRDADT
jgi:hypothetical protein